MKLNWKQLKIIIIYRISNLCTVYNGQPWDLKNVVVMQRVIKTGLIVLTKNDSSLWTTSTYNWEPEILYIRKFYNAHLKNIFDMKQEIFSFSLKILGSTLFEPTLPHQINEALGWIENYYWNLETEVKVTKTFRCRFQVKIVDCRF